jgi:hypothetical protein
LPTWEGDRFPFAAIVCRSFEDAISLRLGDRLEPGQLDVVGDQQDRHPEVGLEHPAERLALLVADGLLRDQAQAELRRQVGAAVLAELDPVHLDLVVAVRAGELGLVDHPLEQHVGLVDVGDDAGRPVEELDHPVPLRFS